MKDSEGKKKRQAVFSFIPIFCSFFVLPQEAKLLQSVRRSFPKQFENVGCAVASLAAWSRKESAKKKKSKKFNPSRTELGVGIEEECPWKRV